MTSSKHRRNRVTAVALLLILSLFVFAAPVSAQEFLYGDVVPQTPLGKVLSAILILIGYSLSIVPTGFVSAELVGDRLRAASHAQCPGCGVRGHTADARYCDQCGSELPRESARAESDGK